VSGWEEALWRIVHPLFRESLRAQIEAEIAAYYEREEFVRMVEELRRDMASTTRTPPPPKREVGR